MMIVSTRAPVTRWLLAAAYTLAALLVHGAHDHGVDSDANVAQHEAGCDDLRLHLSGHPSPDLGHHPIDCAACQFRTNHHVWQFTLPAFVQPSRALAVESSSIPARTAPFRLFSSRAPPCA